MKVLINMLPEAGHLNPTFPLARALTERGHDVVYTSLLDLEKSVVDRGFGFKALHADYVPRGRLAEIEQLDTESDREMEWNRIRSCILADYFDGRDLKCAVREIDPDIILADIVSASPMQYIAHSLKIPCLQLSTSFSQRFDELPPLLSPLPPNTPPLELAASRWESSSVRIFGPIPFTSYICRDVDAYCARFAYPRHKISFQSTFAATLNTFPEALLASSVLDFPRHSDSDKPDYLAVPVDVNRQENASETLQNFVNSDAPVVYASLGSQPGRYAHTNQFFRSLLEALRARPNLRAVVSTGTKYFTNQLFANTPDNVLIMKSVPQLWMLRRSAVFVTHGGLGSTREAMALGVPMIVVPQQYDQLGNAARVVHHGIGLKISARYVTGRALTSAIENILHHNAEFKSRLKNMQQASANEEAENRGVKLIEKLANASKKDQAETKSALPTQQLNLIPKDAPCKAWLFIGALSGFTTFNPGTVVTCPKRNEPVGIGTAGFTLYQTLEGALSRAAGPMLVRVEVSDDVAVNGFHVLGRKLRCLWRIDLSDPLFEYASWCASKAMTEDKQREPETVTAFTEYIEEFHKHRRGLMSISEKINFSMGILDRATRILDRGYAASAAAVNLGAHDAAKLSRHDAIVTTLRQICSKPEAPELDANKCEQHYQRIAAEYDKEFSDRITSYLRTLNFTDVQ